MLANYFEDRRLLVKRMNAEMAAMTNLIRLQRLAEELKKVNDRIRRGC